MLKKHHSLLSQKGFKLLNDYENYRKAEETGPQLGLPIIEELGLCFHECREEITMPVLILAPVLKIFENGIALILRISLEMPVDGYVSPISNFLRQICCIENELGLEKCVLSCLCQESQVKGQIEIR